MQKVGSSICKKIDYTLLFMFYYFQSVNLYGESMLVGALARPGEESFEGASVTDRVDGKAQPKGLLHLFVASLSTA